MNVVKLLRSQPQGKRDIQVFIQVDGKDAGLVMFPMEVWIKFNKIIQLGNEANAKQNMAHQLKIVVEGFIPASELPAQKVETEQELERSLNDPKSEFFMEGLVDAPQEKESVVTKLARTLKEDSDAGISEDKAS